MRIWCFDDKQSSWGKMLFLAAMQRGHDARLFKSSREVNEPGFLFFRMEQANAAKQRAEALICLDKQGVIGIQKREAIMEYENKVYQTKKFSHWMPKTYFVNQEKDAKWTAEELGFPIVSKSRSGSGSAAVRLIPNMESALAEAEVVFSRGLHVDREVQHGYLLWQKFLPDNEYSYRVVRIGNYYWMLRVFNRDNLPLSSGSGKFEPVVPRSVESCAAFEFAEKFIGATQSKWVGVDLLFDDVVKQWRAIETTLAWNLHSPGANVSCPMFSRGSRFPTTGYIGAHQFEVLVSELEKGVFDG